MTERDETDEIDGDASAEEGVAHVWRRETDGVVVEVAPQFLESESAPDEDRFIWRYAIRIVNQRAGAVRLLRRHWRLVDCRGHAEEVRGDGVVGRQPRIEPGSAFAYASFAPLRAPSGVMGGAFEMVAQSGEVLTIATPHFSLDSPYDAPTPN